MTEPPTTDGPSGPARHIDVGDEIDVDIGNVAHGGVCVARIDGRVVFVRHALPGERVTVRITSVRSGSYCRGDAVRILRASTHRVPPPCAHFGPGGCGGCDFQHATGDYQRELKAAVVAEQFRRLARLDVSVAVEPISGEAFGWRGRVRWGVGRAADEVMVGPRRYRSHEIVPVTTERPCLIAADGIAAPAAENVPASADEGVFVRRAGRSPAVAWLRRGRPVGRRAPGSGRVVTESAASRTFAVDAAGFWQPHVAAADALAAAVQAELASFDLAGGTAWDLYGGVGLFASVLAETVGDGGSVRTVESDATASGHARRNLADLPQVAVTKGRVEHVLSSWADPVDAIVLDPPRSGAGRIVCEHLAGRTPSVIVYVACDPAALARDAAILGSHGYRLDRLRAFDAFPQTHHVECVATFVPA